MRRLSSPLHRLRRSAGHDTDGNGTYDRGTDQAVPEPDDDDTDVVEDGADYRVD